MGSTIITATTVSVSSDGTSMSCVFPLSGATTGSYDVVVTNPNGGSTLTQPGAFNVQSGGGANLSVQIVGYTVIRTGVPSTYYVSVTNSGNANAYMVPVWITLPVNLPFNIGTLGATLSAQLPSTDGTNNHVSLMIPEVDPGQTVEFPIQITSPADNPKITIDAVLQAPWFATLDNLNSYMATETYVPACVPDPVNSYASNCLGEYMNDLGTSSSPLAAARTNPAAPTPDDGPVQTAKAWLDGAKDGLEKGQEDAAAGVNNYPPKPITPDNAAYDFGYGVGIISGAINSGIHNGLNMGGKLSPSPRSGCRHRQRWRGRARRRHGRATAHLRNRHHLHHVPGIQRPHEKTGPTGDGSASHYVTASAPLNYFVGFEKSSHCRPGRRHRSCYRSARSRQGGSHHPQALLYRYWQQPHHSAFRHQQLRHHLHAARRHQLRCAHPGQPRPADRSTEVDLPDPRPKHQPAPLRPHHRLPSPRP